MCDTAIHTSSTFIHHSILVSGFDIRLSPPVYHSLLYTIISCRLLLISSSVASSVSLIFCLLLTSSSSGFYIFLNHLRSCIVIRFYISIISCRLFYIIVRFKIHRRSQRLISRGHFLAPIPSNSALRLSSFLPCNLPLLPSS